LPVLVMTAGWQNEAVDLLSVTTRLGADRSLSKARLIDELLPTVASITAAPDPSG
jgi:hypothetical protein